MVNDYRLWVRTHQKKWIYAWACQVCMDCANSKVAVRTGRRRHGHESIHDIFLEQIWTNTYQTGNPIACLFDNLLTAKNWAILLKASLKNFLAGPFPRTLPALCCTALQRAETKEKWCPFDRIAFSLKNSLSISQVHSWVLQLIWFSPSQIHILLALLYPFMTFDKVKLFYSSLRKKKTSLGISSFHHGSFSYTGDQWSVVSLANCCRVPGCGTITTGPLPPLLFPHSTGMLVGVLSAQQQASLEEFPMYHGTS